MKEKFNLHTEIIPRLKVIYMRRVGEYGVENYKLMEKFKLWLSQNDLFG